jgi:hypothetical protein
MGPGKRLDDWRRQEITAYHRCSLKTKCTFMWIGSSVDELEGWTAVPREDGIFAFSCGTFLDGNGVPQRFTVHA